MLSKLLIAIVYGLVAWLVCLLLGTLLVSVGAPSWLVALGAMLKEFAALIGLIAALWSYATGTTFPRP